MHEHRRIHTLKGRLEEQAAQPVVQLVRLASESAVPLAVRQPAMADVQCTAWVLC